MGALTETTPCPLASPHWEHCDPEEAPCVASSPPSDSLLRRWFVREMVETNGRCAPVKISIVQSPPTVTATCSSRHKLESPPTSPSPCPSDVASIGCDNYVSLPQLCRSTSNIQEHPLIQRYTNSAGNASACGDRSLTDAVDVRTVAVRARSCRSAPPTPARPLVSYDVFLGGSCNPTTWRHDLAIPHLEKLDISYYNPQKSSWHSGLIALEETAKQSCQVLLFVIDDQTRAVASMVEAAFLAAVGRRLMLVVRRLAGAGQVICGQPISQSEYQELSAARDCLLELVEQHHSLMTFDSVPAALGSIEQFLYVDTNSQLRALTNVETNNVRNSNTFDDVSSVRSVFVDSCPDGREYLTYAEAAVALSSICKLPSLQPQQLALMELRISESCVTDVEASLEDVSGAGDSSVGSLSFSAFCALLRELRASQPTVVQPAHRHRSGSVSSKLYQLLSRAADRVLPRRRSSRQLRRRQRHVGGQADNYDSSTPSVDVCVVADKAMSKWIKQLAGPTFSKSGLQVGMLDGCTMALLSRIERCRCVLFVIDGSTLGAQQLCLAAHCVGAGLSAVLCVQKLPESCIIRGEQLSAAAIKDYNRGRSYLTDVANRHDVPVFLSADEALQCVIQRCMTS